LPVPRTAADGFFMKLSTLTGAVLTFTSYNKQWDGDEWFESIQVAASTTGGDGYIRFKVQSSKGGLLVLCFWFLVFLA